MPRIVALALAATLVSFSGCSCEPPPPTSPALVETALADGTAEHSYSASLSATDGTPPYAFTAQGVPSGLTLSTGGALQGTPTGGGDFSLQVTVTDANGETDSATFPLKIFPAVAITTTSLPPGTTGTAYAAAVAVTGGKPPVIVRLGSGTLPSGIALASGAISGTPTASGIANLTLTADDANGASASANLSLDVRDPLSISSGSPADGYAGRSYGATLAVAGGAAPYTWSIASGALPSGLSLAADGSISGMPGAPGNASVSVQVSDRDGRTATQVLALAVFAPTAIAASPCPDGYLTEAYSAQWAVTGGKAPLSWAVSTGALPGGLGLGGTTGAITGTPAAAGPASADVTVTDANGVSDTRTCALGVYTLPAIATATPLPDLTTGTAATGTFSATGGKAPLSWTAVGALPTGLTLNPSSGAYSGTADAASSNGQTWTFDVLVTDANGRQSSRTFSATAWRMPVINTTSLADGYAGRSYGTTLAVTGGAPPLTWSVASGALPSGLALAADGSISGTPGAPVTASVTVQVIDRGGRSAMQPLALAVFAPTAIAASPCPDGYLTEAYSAQWTATGGKAPLSWTVSAGALPGGLSLGSATGAISGTPAATGPASAGVTVTDANGVSDTGTCALGVYALPAIATATPLPDLTAGAAATGTFSASGGKAPLSWTSTGALPTGLALNASSGALTGTVDVAASNGQSWSFDVLVTDANGRQSSRTFGVTAWRTPVIDTTSLANATEYAPYSPVSIQAHDGKAPLSYAISGLPSGLSASAAGLLSGTPLPLSRGTHPLTVTVTDSGGRVATASRVIIVLPGTPTVDSVSPGFGTVAGGTRVTITGTNFFGATVTMAGQPAAATVSGGGTILDFTTPAGSGQGPATISVTNDSNLSLGANYTYTLERTIDPDGSSADWTPAFQVGTNPGPSSWPITDLQALYAAYDADNFYVGVAGTLDPSTGNTLILYVDADPGTGSGVTDYSTLQDNNGLLDDACTNDG
ncbi:MAG TPA: putative Ig domain-containing protein, partial [Myxococcaceae bacterium]